MLVPEYITDHIERFSPDSKKSACLMNSECESRHIVDLKLVKEPYPKQIGLKCTCAIHHALGQLISTRCNIIVAL
jgi:hypothetical protein